MSMCGVPCLAVRFSRAVAFSVDVGCGRMRMRLGAAAVRYQMPVLVLLACRIRLAPLFDKGDGEGGGTNDSGRLG